MSRILIFILLIMNLSLSAQKVHKISLTPKKSINDTDFSITKIIDNRVNKDNIGNVRKGMNNKNVSASFDKSFELEILFAMSKIVPRKKEHTEIGMLFHNFNITEIITNTKETGHCFIEMEFVQEIDSVLYSLGYFEVEVSNSGLDVTNSHGNRIVKALKQCVDEFRETDWRNNKSKFVFEEPKDAVFNYNEIPKKGMYQSFNKMALNEPYSEEDLTFETKSAKKFTHYYPKLADGKLRRKTYFISDGKDVYIKASQYSYGKYFTKVLDKGRYYYFEDKVQDYNTAAAAAFGLAGALISSASNTVKPYILDTDDGKIYTLSERKLSTLISKHPDIIKTYRQSKRKLADKKAAIIALNKTFE